MFDLLRNLTKSAEEKRQEQVTAYVDGELSPRARQRFEQLMANDPSLQAEVAELQEFKQNLRQLPRRRVPRNFTLDPATYQAPQRQPLLQMYPVMRTATVITAVFLIIAISAELLTFTGARDAALSAEPVAMESDAAPEAAMDTAAFDEAASEASAEEETAEEEMAEAAVPSDIETTASANAAETMLESEAAPEAEMEIEEDVIVEEAEEMAEEPAEAPAPTQVPTVKATPIDIDSEASVLSEEAASAEDGADDAPTDSITTQSAAAATPTLAATATTDTPRIQPTPTLADRAATSPPAATEIAAATVTVDAGEQDLSQETAVSPPPPPTSPISTLRLIQIVLAALLVVLGTAVWYARRQL